MEKNKNKKIRKQLRKLRQADELTNSRLDKAESRMQRIEQGLVGLEAIIEHKIADIKSAYRKFYESDEVSHPVNEKLSSPKLGEIFAKMTEYEGNLKRKQFIQDAIDYFEENEHRLRKDVPEMNGFFGYSSSTAEERTVKMNLEFFKRDTFKETVIESTTSRAMIEDVYNENVGFALCLAKLLQDEEAIDKFSNPVNPYVPILGMVFSKSGRILEDTNAKY